MTPLPPVRRNRHAAFGLTAETQYDKCVALARNLWWSWHADVINLFRDLDPDPLAATGPQSHRPALRIHARAAGNAGGRTGALQPHQSGLSPAEGVLGETPPWGRTHAGVLGSKPVAYFSLEFGVHESVPIYSGGLGRAFGRPHQERQRAGRAAGGHRAVLRPGLFQAASRHQRLAERGVSRHEGREPADGAGPGRRRQTDHRADRHPQRQAAGQGLADARRASAAVPVGLRRAEQQSRGPAS